jgi:uncharacterized protein YdaL
MYQALSPSHRLRRAGRIGRAAVVLLATAICLCAQTAPPPGGSASVAIYYDGPDQPVAEGYLDAHQIQSLLGHFGLRGEMVPLEQYRPGQLARYQAAFFLGTVTGTRFPSGFLADVRASRSPFCWLGRHVGGLLKTAEARRYFGFSYVDYRDDLEFREVEYKGVTLPKEDPDLNIITVTDPAGVQVLSTAVNDEKVRHPYALRRNRFWYIADMPFSYAEEGGRYLVFCDLLHDILGVQHPAQALALARIEDVSTDIDPADLRALADVLAARRTPFQIAIIPVFRDPAKGYEVYLSDRPALVEAVHYMVARGGTPVLHGATHQYHGVSGDDYEFWDDVGNRPTLGDSRQTVLQRLELGLRESFANDIFPIAFETPHYAASETDYRAMQEVFSLFNERTMATPDISSIQYFPYPTIDRYGRYIVPENLGYLTADNADPKVLIQRARNLRVVRDSVASFYFHAFLDPALLDQVVQGISGLGYRFVSLRQFGGRVNYQGKYAVRTASGPEHVSLDREFWRSRLYDAGGRLVDEKSSSARQQGAVEVTLQVPPDGWGALNSIKEHRPEAGMPHWAVRIKQWWNGLQPARRSLDGGGRIASRKAWVLWLPDASVGDTNNQKSYSKVLETFGYQVKPVRLSEFSLMPPDTETLLAIPRASGARLSERQQRDVLGYLARGGRVVADGRQDWLTRLGFSWTEHHIPVATVTDVLFPEMPLRWQPEESIERFTPPEGVEQLMVDPLSKQILALAGTHGRGRYLHLAAQLDPRTTQGTSHYPYLMEYLAEGLRMPPVLSSPRLEVYFDPSFREGANLSRLAASWRQAGIRTIYAAAWQSYKNQEFDYDQFISTCHRNGISVYAWLVLPAVTRSMWEQHPEWRERTAAGSDGRVGWRYLMNLQNPSCFRAAMDWMKETLSAHRWDGVNIAELNFDADFLNYLRPDRFVPMNDDVRAEFHRRAGFDPAQLFAPASPYYLERNPQALEQFLRYREDVVTDWHRKVLRELEPLEKAHGWEVIVTMLDSLHSNYVKPALGVDSRRLIAMMKEFDFTLQVEDPAEHWMKPPDRYRSFAETYLALVPDRRRLMFDINVMPDRDVAGTGLPSTRATGGELAETVVAAAGASGRVAIYSEYTVASQDWRLIGVALAQPSGIEGAGNGWTLDSSVPVQLASSGDRNWYLGGRLWPAVSADGVLIPSGHHLLSFSRPWYQFLDREERPTRLLRLSGDLIDTREKTNGIAVRYTSRSRTVLLLNQKPLAVRLDGVDAKPLVEEGGGRFALLVPAGEHSVEVNTSTSAGALVNLWSYISASAIAAFGAVTTFLMAAIYLRIRLNRPPRRRRVS